MSREHNEYVTQAKEPSPYRIMRKKNVKTYKVQLKEMYPSIRPKIDKCSKEEKSNWDKGLKDCGCKLQNYDCLKCDTNPYTVPRRKLVKLDPVTEYCKNRKPIEGTPDWTKKANMKLDWNKINPYDVLRMENCKEFDFTDCEMYHSIRPPQYKCSMEKTANVLYGAVEDSALERVFDMEQDDVVNIYKRIPKGKALKFYGIDSYKNAPEAIEFNRLISACIDKASPPKPKIKPVRPKPPPKHTKQPCSMILNRPELEKMVGEMPNVVTNLDYKSTFCWKYRSSRRCTKPKEPFTKDLSKPTPVPLDAALDMVKPVKKEKHGLRRKHKYCELVCGLPENACTELAYRQYLYSPEEYDAAYLEEMKREAQFAKPEPENYEALFKELITCFERQPCDQSHKDMKDCFDNLNYQGGGDDDESYVSEDKKSEAEEVPEPDKPKPKKEPKHKERRPTKEPLPPPPPPPPEPQPEPVPPPEKIPTPKSSSSSSSVRPPPPKAKKPDIKRSNLEGKDCPCDLCQWMKKGETEPDTPEMSKWKKEAERLKLMDYIKMKCHQDYMSTRPQEYRAPLRKCDDIVCDNCFCCTNGFSDCCDALGIIQELESVLPPKHSSLLQCIRDRISSFLCSYV